MQTIETSYITCSLVYIWVELMKPLLFTRKTYLGYDYRHEVFKKLDVKPINCGTCLSFWIGILLTIIYFNFFFLTLPIMYKLINKII